MGFADFEGGLGTQLDDLGPWVAITPGSSEARVLDAALVCIARFGLTKTTLDDIAREADCSRATVYRLFPGGKQTLLHTVGRHEVLRLLAEVAAAVDGLDELDEVLAAAIHTASSFVADHSALGAMIRHDADMLLPVLAFERIEPLLAAATLLLGPYLSPHLDDATAAEAAEWAARIALSYNFNPDDRVDLTDLDRVRQLVTQTMMPGLRIAASMAASEVNLTGATADTNDLVPNPT